MKTSAHLEGCKIASAEAHNKRTKELNYVCKELSHLNESFSYIDHSLQRELAIIKKEVKQKTGRKLQKNAIPIKEGVVVIKQDTTIDELKDFCERCRKEFGIIPLQIYTHKDEGYKNCKEWTPNLHAHIIWRVYNEEGRNVSPTPYQCSQMQTIASECLGMERGKKSGKKHLSSLEFKIQEEQKRIEELRNENEELREERTALRTEVHNLNKQAESLREDVETLQNGSEAIPGGILGNLKNKLSKFSDTANGLLETIDLGNVRKVKKLEEENNSLKSELKSEKDEKEAWRIKVIADTDDELRQQRNKHKRELEESGDYKYRYEQLSENVDANEEYKFYWNILPMVVEDSEKNKLNLTLPQMMDIARLSTIGIEQLPSGEKMSDISEKGKIELKWDVHLRAIVLRMTSAMKQRGSQVWAKVEDWRVRFKETMQKLLEKDIEENKESEKKSQIRAKGRGI